MAETLEERKKRHHQEDLQRLRGFRPIDDTFMRCLFRNNVPLAEMVLRIITGKNDLQLVSCETQADLKRVTGAKSILLDAYGTDSMGKKYDIEVQRADIGADPHRARYHSSMMDIENLDAGEDFSSLPDTYVIFITENDYFGENQPLYPVQNIITTTGKPTHIIYVNGEYRGDSDVGKLMHDFNCTQANDMIFPLMAEKTRYLKENPKGVSEVCKQMEDLRNESILEGKILTLIDLVQDGTLDIEIAAAKANMTVDEFKETMGKAPFQPTGVPCKSYMVRWWASFFASSRMNHRQHPGMLRSAVVAYAGFCVMWSTGYKIILPIRIKSLSVPLPFG